jgi:hypothetical protein
MGPRGGVVTQRSANLKTWPLKSTRGQDLTANINKRTHGRPASEAPARREPQVATLGLQFLTNSGGSVAHLIDGLLKLLFARQADGSSI